MKLKCKCDHKGQDELHGKNVRVHNPLKRKQSEPQKWRCTVCGTVREEK